MPYDPKLPGCFGQQDLQFAIHPSDQTHAFEWLIDLRKNQALWIDVKIQVQTYLEEQGVLPVKIAEEVSRARRMFGPWLYGPVGDEEP